MSKYFKLTEHLAGIDDELVSFSFNELEELLGFPLPESARQYQAWWSNQRRSQSLAWQLAGWKTTSLDLERERVTFKYVAGEPEDDVSLVPRVQAMTIGEAKLALASTFGVEPSQIEITIRA